MQCFVSLPERLKDYTQKIPLGSGRCKRTLEVSNLASKKVIFKKGSFLKGKRRSKTGMFGHFRGLCCAASYRQNSVETGFLLSHRPFCRFWNPGLTPHTARNLSGCVLPSTGEEI